MSEHDEDNVVPIEKNLPHYAGWAECRECGYRVVSVCPVSTGGVNLECSKCGEMTCDLVGERAGELIVNPKHCPGKVDYAALEQAFTEMTWGTEKPTAMLVPARCVCGAAGIAMVSRAGGVLKFGEVTDTGEIVVHACKKDLDQ